MTSDSRQMEAIVADFKRGLSMVGLSRKYGTKKAQIESAIRRWMNAGSKTK